MPKLRAKDLQDVLGILTDLYQCGSDSEWTEKVLTSIRSLIPSDHASYNEIRYDLPAVVAKWNPNNADLLAKLAPIFTRFLDEHPTASLIHRTACKTALRWSDVKAPAAFKRTALYNEYFRQIDMQAQLAVALSVSPDRLVPLALGRSKGDFSDRDKLLLDMIAPHLTQSYLNARQVTTLKQRLKAVEFSIEALDRGVLELTPQGKIAWATPKAYAWLSTYWTTTRSSMDTLPDSLSQWIRCQESILATTSATSVHPSPIILERAEYRLMVSLVRDGAQRLLLFVEQRLQCSLDKLHELGLGRRESEVLSWVAKGKTNDEIGTILGLSTKTVKKHLERIFEKLGVESRTAAAAVALQTMER